MLQNFIKIILSVLFLVCLFKMPYGYYQVVRLVGFVGFILLAYKSYTDKAINMAIIYCGLALLFQPLFKIALGRTIWNVVDVLVSIFLIATIFYNQATKRNTNSSHEL
ncbi:MAG: hypothetical protein JSU07_01740 [Bacteroidetes bacterium]|nr:hypothetical protein [Bacteroidota bacterium]